MENRIPSRDVGEYRRGSWDTSRHHGHGGGRWGHAAITHGRRIAAATATFTENRILSLRSLERRCIGMPTQVGGVLTYRGNGRKGEYRQDDARLFHRMSRTHLNARVTASPPSPNGKENRRRESLASPSPNTYRRRPRTAASRSLIPRRHDVNTTLNTQSTSSLPVVESIIRCHCTGRRSACLATLPRLLQSPRSPRRGCQWGQQVNV